MHLLTDDSRIILRHFIIHVFLSEGFSHQISPILQLLFELLDDFGDRFFVALDLDDLSNFLIIETVRHGLGLQIG